MKNMEEILQDIQVLEEGYEKLETDEVSVKESQEVSSNVSVEEKEEENENTAVEDIEEKDSCKTFCEERNNLLNFFEKRVYEGVA
jgi:hypothetical protein